MHGFWSIKIMSPKGIAPPILSITLEAPASSQNLNLTSPPFQAGLPTVPLDLGTRKGREHMGPCCRTLPWRGKHFSPWSYTADLLQGNACWGQESYKSARWGAKEPWETLWRGRDIFLLDNHLYFPIFSFYHPQNSPLQNIADSWMSLHTPTFP